MARKSRKTPAPVMAPVIAPVPLAPPEAPRALAPAAPVRPPVRAERPLVRLAVLAAVGALALGITALQARSDAPQTTVEAASVPPLRTVAAEGRVVARPGSEVTVSAERSGRLVALRVDERQAVRRGQVLAEIESSEVVAALAESRARVAESESDVRLAELTLDRRTGLAADGVISAQDLDQARRDLEGARARVETARAEAARHQAALEKSRVLAPLDGTVVLRHVDAGETVAAGEPLLTVADLRRVRIEGESDEADAASLGVGRSVVITSDAYPGLSWRGTVEEVADAVTVRRLKPQDPTRPSDTRVLGVKVAFAEPTPLKLGATVDLKIDAR